MIMKRLLAHTATRAVECMLACMLIAWSLGMIMFDRMLVDHAYDFFAILAPIRDWGLVGFMIGCARLAGIIINGSWRRSPLLRLLGAVTGGMWWVAITALFWLAVVKDSGNPFPMLFGYPVFVIFEGVSCYRCGQDACSMQSFKSWRVARGV